MGLAASQARLLTITARKADCEFQSMMLSHQKIALSRDMEKISTQYQNSLNATKLVYDYYGSGDSDMSLTYGLLMTPSAYNDYYPKLVTDAKNRIILNSAYASAARAAGIPAEGLSGTPSSDVRNRFIECLANANIISTSVATSIEGVTYNNAIGNGSTISATQGITEVNYDQLLDMIDAYCLSSDSWNGQALTIGTKNDKCEYSNRPERLTVFNGNAKGEQVYDNEIGASLKLSDLLNKDKTYVLSLESDWGYRTPIMEAAYLRNKIVGDGSHPSIMDWICDSFSQILGGTQASDTALQYALNSVYDLLNPNNNLTYAANHMLEDCKGEQATDRKHWTEPGDNSGVDGLSYANVLDQIGKNEGGKIGENYDSSIEDKTLGFIGFQYYADRCHSGGAKKQTSEAGINLSSLTQVFLTAYVQYMQGIEDSTYSWKIGKETESNLYNPEEDKDFKFTIVTESDIDNNDQQLQANFYDTLFNRICLNGWTENDRIDDEEYMGEMLKSGMAYISTIGDDGYYYQGNYSTDRSILEVKDDDAIAKAQAKYNTEKTKIENKEETIDMKMKNLDTEISSLTTEYDSTKQIITKSVEKSFKRYEA